MEGTNRALKELLAKVISPEARRNLHLALPEVLFHMNFLSFDDKGFNPAYKPYKEHTPDPGDMERSYLHKMVATSPLLTHERRYGYVFPQTATMTIWVPVRDVCPAMNQPAFTKERIIQYG